MTNTATNKHVLIGGGSGFIGRALTEVLRARGDRVTLISRYEGKDRVTWDHVRDHGIPRCDVVINLAGKHILDMSRLWTRRYRDEVIRSRVETTKTLVRAINAQAEPPSVFISTAGKCFYGSQAFRTPEQYFDMDERCSPVGIDFPSEVVGLWEQAAMGVDARRVRHVKLRFGIVLGNKPTSPRTDMPNRLGAHGIFPLLQAVFDRGLCLRLGAGVQPFPWVHVDDVVGICVRAIDQPHMHGIYNAVAPGIVSNSEFTELLASKLGRAVLGRVPAWLIKAVVGLERSTILLLGQRVKPTRTIEHGYKFKFPGLGKCLDDLLGNV